MASSCPAATSSATARSPPLRASRCLFRTRRPELLAGPAQRRPVERLGEQHLLGEDQVRAVVVRHLVVVAHRDRVERARDLAVAAEDAPREVDLVHRRVALAGADAVLGGVLGRHDADAIGRAGGGAERAADALLEPGVLEPVQLVAAAEARVDRGLLLRVLVGVCALGPAPEHGLHAAQRLAEGAVGPADGPALGGAHHLEDVGSGVIGHYVATTRIAVTSALTVASGRKIFQPSDMSW